MTATACFLQVVVFLWKTMSISLTTFNPNTKAQSSQVNTNFTNVSQGVTDTSYRAFAWGVPGTLIVGDEQGMKYIVPQDVTAIKILAKTDSGTATIRLQKDTTDIESSIALTSSVGTTTSLDAVVISEGQVLTLDITAADGIGLYVTLETQVTTIV